MRFSTDFANVAINIIFLLQTAKSVKSTLGTFTDCPRDASRVSILHRDGHRGWGQSSPFQESSCSSQVGLLCDLLPHWMPI